MIELMRCVSQAGFGKILSREMKRPWSVVVSSLADDVANTHQYRLGADLLVQRFA